VFGGKFKAPNPTKFILLNQNIFLKSNFITSKSQLFKLHKYILKIDLLSAILVAKFYTLVHKIEYYKFVIFFLSSTKPNQIFLLILKYFDINFFVVSYLNSIFLAVLKSYKCSEVRISISLSFLAVAILNSSNLLFIYPLELIL